MFGFFLLKREKVTREDKIITILHSGYSLSVPDCINLLYQSESWCAAIHDENKRI